MKNLKKTYFRQVKRALQCDRKTRKRILHDLSEAFDAARRDGKTETETIALLGNAQELHNRSHRSLTNRHSVKTEPSAPLPC